MNKFKVGDELMYIGNAPEWRHKPGTLLIVKHENADARYPVQAYYDLVNKYYDNFSYEVIRKPTKLDKALA